MSKFFNSADAIVVCLCLLMTVATGHCQAAAQCEELCTVAFWQKATVADIQALLDAGPAGERLSDLPPFESLHWAAAYSQTPAVVALLIKQGLDIEARSGELERTPLHSAAALSNTPAVVVLLIKQGANLEARDKISHTPLHVAVAEGENPEIVALLIEGGADLGAKDKNGATPLHWSAKYGKSPEVLELLLKQGANISARDNYGLTPMHWAARRSKSILRTATMATILFDYRQ